LGHFGKKIRNTLKVLKCGAGEEWRREMKYKKSQVKRNVLQTIKRRKANWIGHILHKTCLLRHVFEGQIEGRSVVTARRGGRLKQLLGDLKEKGGHCKLKEEALDRTVWRTRSGMGDGLVRGTEE